MHVFWFNESFEIFSDEKQLDFLCIQGIEKKLSSLLMDFQKYGVAFGVKNSGRCMIADDMGLGLCTVLYHFVFYFDEF